MHGDVLFVVRVASGLPHVVDFGVVLQDDGYGKEHRRGHDVHDGVHVGGAHGLARVHIHRALGEDGTCRGREGNHHGCGESWPL